MPNFSILSHFIYYFNTIIIYLFQETCLQEEQYLHF